VGEGVGGGGFAPTTSGAQGPVARMVGGCRGLVVAMVEDVSGDAAPNAYRFAVPVPASAHDCTSAVDRTTSGVCETEGDGAKSVEFGRAFVIPVTMPEPSPPVLGAPAKGLRLVG
jgi:hypothetical protein